MEVSVSPSSAAVQSQSTQLILILNYFFKNIYCVYNILCICLQARGGHQTSLEMVVNQHVDFGN